MSGTRDLIRRLRSDYARHAASASHRSMPALAAYRFGRWAREQPAPAAWLGSKVYGAALLAAEVVSGIFLDRDTEIGESVHFVHAGGINIHPATRIGDRVGIMHGVTLGVGPTGEAPTIGNDVFIGANATIVGGVKVGDGARVAANTLVLNDVPPGRLAIGVPAKMVAQIPFSGAKKDAEAAPEAPVKAGRLEK